MGKVKAAGYARVSTVGQADGTSPEEQKKAIEQECIKREFELYNFYCDVASGKNMDRPQLKQLLSDAKEHKFQILIFTNLDRLGRNLRDNKNILYEISDSYGIEFICIEQPQVSGTGDQANLMLNMLSTFAEYERGAIGKRTRSGRMAVWKNNIKTIGSLPFGYARPDKDIIILEDKAKIYHDIVSMYLDQGYSIRDIAVKLKNEGIPSPSGKSPNWYSKTINDILKNPAYKGEAIQNRFKTTLQKGKRGNQYYAATKDQRLENEWVTVNFPPLISEEKFDQIQARLDQQKRKPKKRHYGYEDHFIADSLLYCKYCGGKVRKQITPIANFRYCCHWYSTAHQELEIFNRKKCTLHLHDAEKIDEMILRYISDLLSNPQKFAKEWFKQSDIDELEAKLNNFKKRHNELQESLSDGFRRLTSAKDLEIKKIYQVEIEKIEKEFSENKRNLKNTETELRAILYKVNHFEEYQKKMNGSSKFSTFFKTKDAFKTFIRQLPFKEKKRIIEAVVSPETGGKIFLENHPENSNDFDLEFDFKMDIDKVGKIITSLDKRSLLNIVDIR